RETVDHIREIVATQQNYARNDVVKTAKPERIDALIDHALRVAESALIRHSIVVEKEIQELPPIILERHHLLQILINLITNAKRAVSVRAPGERRIRIRVRQVDDRIAISIIDNGCGIPPENMSKLFRHGFTTHPKGHGFGLHSSALTARAMDGRIFASSDGPDHGATFTLEIPATLSVRSKAA
ncbi:MAG TPA: ATP-binding protein, partial [Phycisphaerales bacterium]|nr:ATP-binding protein [Phycisphaerales bacterium]